MNIRSKVSEHWTDQQLIEHLYGVGPEDEHARTCEDCLERLSAMRNSRRLMEGTASAAEDLSFEALAAQRRQIYARIDQPRHWMASGYFRRLAGVAAAVLVVGGGAALLDQKYPPGTGTNSLVLERAKVSDAQLVSDVSRFAEEPEPSSTAPLQALFED